ncbi:SusC/RagA family TonB-linked outer membrane protein [Leeuwenhoekiella nanhaiensis]|uniref:SusC/RagA family TonB-linked outer membrane protein n=1 Tax=Leeuwenhoekiella nanhaiensis TaxID=1655491 RepID=UPI0016714468|nr:TonB-dependent receptor [Leeuwenhoekiella nanhaiensis]
MTNYYLTKKAAVLYSMLLFLFSLSVSAQEKQITGVVTDMNSTPLPGVSVLVKGTTTGTVTGFDGDYSITATPQDILVFSYVGFNEQEITVGTKTTINVSLQENVAELNEVVLVGYGQKSKTTLTGSVSTVKGEELVKSPQPNLSNSFAGRLSGVVANNRSGEPGADGATIRIRGISTTGDNDPLVVIDGIPNRLGGLERLNPNDVENITVLKDASAAIYGAQAANGVILITTKRGKLGKPSFSVTANQGFSTPANLPGLADSPTYARILNEINFYRNPSGGMNQIYTEEEINLFANGSNPDVYPNTSWTDEAISDWSLQDNENISIRGGGENFRYFTSLGRTNQDGIYKNGINNYKQVNLRANLDVDVTSNLTLGVDLNYRKEDRIFPTRSAGDIFRAIYRTYPTIPARYTNGLPSAGVEQGQNPIIIPTGIPGTDVQPTTVLNSTITLDYKLPIEGLSIKGFYSEDRSFAARKRFAIPFTVYQIDNSTNPPSFNEVIAGPDSRTPELLQAQDNRQLQTANIRLNFERSFGLHHINSFIAYEQQESDRSYFDAFRSGFISAEIPEFNLGGGEPEQSTNSGFSQRFTRRNYFSRISYDYDQKYLAEVQARYDGSSRFAEGNRYGFFPSISAGWRISAEEWFKSENISNLKVKASYGLLGNDRIDPFQYLNTFALRPTDFVDPNGTPLPIFIINQLANPGITWETARKLDIGVSADLFDNFSIELDYFHEVRSDLLTARSGSLPLVSGIVNEFGLAAIIPQENIGEVKNRGFEAVLGYDKTWGEFNFFADANFTFNKNEVVFLDDPQGIPDYQLSKGKPLGSQLLYEAIGIFRTQEDLDNNVTLPGQQLGDLIYRDVDGDGEITELDRVRQELTNVPQIVYGLTLGANYKNFDLTVLWQGQARSVQYVAPESGEVGNFFSTWADNRWSPTNPNGSYPRVDVRTSSSINEGLFRNDFWLVNTSFLRLKNLELGYSLPESSLSFLGIASARVYASGYNLVTFTESKDVDPEGASNSGQFYPQLKTYNIGINVNF